MREVLEAEGRHIVEVRQRCEEVTALERTQAARAKAAQAEAVNEAEIAATLKATKLADEQQSHATLRSLTEATQRQVNEWAAGYEALAMTNSKVVEDMTYSKAVLVRTSSTVAGVRTSSQEGMVPTPIWLPREKILFMDSIFKKEIS